LTFGLATASTSVFGRRRRMVMVFAVTHDLYPARADQAKDFCDAPPGQEWRPGHARWPRCQTERLRVWPRQGAERGE
jgi:hypothetical protein